MGKLDMNEILLHSMPNGWYKKEYVQVLESEFKTFRKSDSMFKHMKFLNRSKNVVVGKTSKNNSGI